MSFDISILLLLWPIICLGYEFAVRKNLNYSSALRITGYFAVIYSISYISLLYFTLAGDEDLYDFCGRNLADLISSGVYFNFPDSACYAVGYNHFTKIIAYAYFLSGKTPYSLVGLNAVLLYVGIDLAIKSFPFSSETKAKAFKIAIFFPPLVYLAIRPAKEAMIAFLIGAVFYGFSLKNSYQRIFILIFSIGLFYTIRWQYAFLCVVACLLLFAWKFLVQLNNRNKLKVLSLTLVLLISFYISVGHKVSNYLYGHHFPPDSVAQNSDLSGALIYKVMLRDVRSLHPWNIFVAHAGGLITPQPLRFIKERLKTGVFLYQILEEFVLVSFWFYSLIPMWGIYFYETILSKMRSAREIDKSEFFKFVLSSLIFSMACLTMLAASPQLFRYKVPLNIYIFCGIILFSIQNRAVLVSKLRAYWLWIAGYFVFMSIYTATYLLW